MKNTIYSTQRPYDTLKKETDFYFRVGGTAEVYTLPKTRIIFVPDFKTLTPAMFGIFSHVKSQARQAEEKGRFKEFDGRWAEYTHDFDPNGFCFRGTEIDIKSAYFKTAHDEQIVSREIYTKYYGKKGPFKLARNAAIGSLNAKKNEYYCTPEKDHFLQHIPAPAPLAYRAVTCRVSAFLQHLAEAGNPVFFWVDQLYFWGKYDRQKVEKTARQWGYELTSEPVTVYRNANGYTVNKAGNKRDFNTKKMRQ